MTQINDQYLKHVEVNNPELLSILNEYPKLYSLPGFKENLHLTASEKMRQRPYYMSESFMKEIIAKGPAHDGFPDEMVGYNLKIQDRTHVFFKRDADPIFKRDFTNRLVELNDRMMNFLSVKHNALCAIYPPNGFISWHSNHNAPGFNLIFTWSETGDGHFSYVHPETKQLIKCDDKEGAGKWTCKAAYFGAWEEQDKVLYHAAETECWRVTVSYVFDMSDTSAELREMILEDIASHE